MEKNIGICNAMILFFQLKLLICKIWKAEKVANWGKTGVKTKGGSAGKRAGLRFKR